MWGHDWLGMVVPITAQLWSIFHGLKLAWESGQTTLLVETACAEALEHILHPDPFFPMADLVTLINNLHTEPWEDLQFNLVSESANNVALTLTILGVLPTAPATIRDIIAEET